MSADQQETAGPKMARVRWLPPRLRPPVPVPVSQMNLLWLVGTAALIAGYDLNIFGLALPQIQRDLQIAEQDTGATIAIIRLGMIGALFLTMLADRVGRRKLLMFTIIGSAVCTLLTGFVETHAQFTTLQMLARVFSYAEEMLCVVVVTEAFEPQSRGWAIGAIGALAASGIGLAALVFALVNILPFGWRALYVVGAVPLFLIAWFRRYLPETKRFQEAAAAQVGKLTLAESFRPLVLLAQEYPRRALLLAATAAPMGFAFGAPAIFLSKQLQQVHGFAPGHVTLLFLIGGMFSLLGTFAAGRLSDVWGRRVVFMASGVICAAGFALFYSVENTYIVIFAWVMATCALLAVDVLLAAFGAELFPTSHRATASGVRLTIWLSSGAAGAWAEGYLYTYFGNDHAMAMLTLLAAAPLAIVAALFLPDAARRELEDVSPEKIEIRH